MLSKLIVTCLVSAMFLFAGVQSDCMGLLSNYYVCKSMPSPFESFPSDLSAITTYNGAMEKYKSIYTELDWNTCSSTLCQCVRGNSTLRLMNYGAFFVNPSYYSDMLMILTSVRNKYTRMNLYGPFYFGNMSMNNSFQEYCFKYDYSFMEFYSYNETMQCLMKNAMGYLTCIQHVSNFTNVTDIMSNPADYKEFLVCIAGLVSTCDVEIRRSLIFNMLSYAPNIVQNGLLNTVNSIVASAESEGQNVMVVWMTGDPHMSSVMKGFETCNFDIPLVCIQSDTVQVNCTGKKFSTSLNVTTLSEVKIRFTKGDESNTFIADQNTFAMTFSNGQTTVKDSSGNDWLKMTTFNTGNFIVITDKNSGMIISIGQFNKYYFLVAQAKKTSFKSGGILLDGCPELFKAQRLTTREKRATSSAASACSSSTSQSSNTLVSSTDLYNGCVNDVLATGDTTFATMYANTLSASSEVKSAYTSAFGAGTQLRATFSYLILAIGFFLYKFF